METLGGGEGESRGKVGTDESEQVGGNNRMEVRGKNAFVMHENRCCNLWPRKEKVSSTPFNRGAMHFNLFVIRNYEPDVKERGHY